MAALNQLICLCVCVCESECESELFFWHFFVSVSLSVSLSYWKTKCDFPTWRHHVNGDTFSNLTVASNGNAKWERCTALDCFFLTLTLYLFFVKFELLNSLIVINQQWIHQCASHVIRGHFPFFVVGHIETFLVTVEKRLRFAYSHIPIYKVCVCVKRDLNRKWIMTFESNVLSLAHEFHLPDIISTTNNFGVFCFSVRVRNFFARYFFFCLFCFIFLWNCALFISSLSESGQFITVTLKSILIS